MDRPSLSTFIEEPVDELVKKPVGIEIKSPILVVGYAAIVQAENVLHPGVELLAGNSHRDGKIGSPLLLQNLAMSPDLGAAGR